MDPPSTTVARIMTDFARLTGLEPEAEEPRRYLWTDAFAVCNFLELHRLTGADVWREFALRLVDQVHRTLGRHRGDDRRSGWLSGLSEAEGELHPTRGGLRIGKPFAERDPRQPPDEGEWDRDGQYFHYLTKWMHALDRVSLVTGDARYLCWARELAVTAHRHFSYRPPFGGAKRMYWKMSIDLSRPQVASMGQHDALDGLVTCSELLRDGTGPEAGPDLELRGAIEELIALCRGQQWETDDALGIGGLLFDAGRIAQLTLSGGAGSLAGAGLLEKVMAAALSGLQLFAEGPSLDAPARYRLAFRELGLSIGLHAERLLRELARGRPEALGGSVARHLAALDAFLPLQKQIEQFWLADGNRTAPSWTEHREINMVMLATSLSPRSFIEL